jgi:hypothetical protein
MGKISKLIRMVTGCIVLVMFMACPQPTDSVDDDPPPPPHATH